MLGNREAIATIAVKDINRARKFYEETLGLKPTRDDEEGTAGYKSGNSDVLVYESQFAGTNKATAATWTTDDVEQEVKTLKEKGVSFEHYDLPGTTRNGDIHVGGNVRVAWFKDPDGNILSIVESKA